MAMLTALLQWVKQSHTFPSFLRLHFPHGPERLNNADSIGIAYTAALRSF